jgi:deazaflavin-dependent oxidoreductase (nitroreductase family)
MNEEIERALQTDRLIDITTTGRKTGNPHRFEITFQYFDEGLFICGLPGTRDWYANIVANPEITFHLKQSLKADIPATATPVLAEAHRRAILAKIVQEWDKQDELEKFMESSPLVKIQLEVGD